MLIKIKNLHLRVIMGVYEWEKDIERDIIINAEITSNEHKSLVSDDILDTIDYAVISEGIEKVVMAKHYKLIEKMAQDVMDFIMRDSRITACKLEIDKISPLENVDSCSVTIMNKNNGS